VFFDLIADGIERSPCGVELLRRSRRSNVLNEPFLDCAKGGGRSLAPRL